MNSICKAMIVGSVNYFAAKYTVGKILGHMFNPVRSQDTRFRSQMYNQRLETIAVITGLATSYIGIVAYLSSRF